MNEKVTEDNFGAERIEDKRLATAPVGKSAVSSTLTPAREGNDGSEAVGDCSPSSSSPLDTQTPL